MSEFVIDEMDKIVDDFCVEVDEMIELTNEDLLDIEENYTDEKINRIFRTFHTVKGNSIMLGFDNLSGFAHKSEDLLSKIREGEIKITKAIIDLLFEITDFIKSSVNYIGNTYKDIVEIDKDLLSKIINITDKDLNIIKTVEIDKSNAEKVEEDQQLKFLIVDDDYISRTILNKTLSQFGECNIAVNGQEAIYAFMLSIEEKSPYDIVFMDINMPNMNGIEASIKIREIEKENGVFGKQEVKLIIVSAINNPREVIRTIYNCGATTYITKPYNIKRINKELELLKLI